MTVTQPSYWGRHQPKYLCIWCFAFYAYYPRHNSRRTQSPKSASSLSLLSCMCACLFQCQVKVRLQCCSLSVPCSWSMLQNPLWWMCLAAWSLTCSHVVSYSQTKVIIISSLQCFSCHFVFFLFPPFPNFFSLTSPLLPFPPTEAEADSGSS